MHKVISSDGTAIAYDVVGAGPPVILVDGAMCSRDFGPMAALAPALAPRFSVFTYDRRGRGDSGDTLPYAIAREVEDIGALIAEAGGSAHLYGVSSGSILAHMAASSGPGVDRLALFEPQLRPDGTGRTPGELGTRLSELIAEGRRGDAVEFFLAEAVRLPAELAARMRTSPMWSALEAMAHTLVYDTTIMARGLVLDPAMDVPTLLIDTGGSPLALRAAARAVAMAVPSIRHLTLAREHPDVLAPALTDFLTKPMGCTPPLAPP